MTEQDATGPVAPTEKTPYDEPTGTAAAADAKDAGAAGNADAGAAGGAAGADGGAGDRASITLI